MSDYQEQPTRVCRKCSAQSTTGGDYCPSCGTSYVRRSRRPSRRVVIASVVALMLVVGTGTAFAVKRHNDTVDRDRATAAAEREADQMAQEEADAQTEADEAERETRADLVKYLEKQITKDAKKSVADGTLDGPIKNTQCTATGGGSTDDLTALTGTFECLAVNKENDDGSAEGYRYSGTAEWATGSITWRLGG